MDSYAVLLPLAWLAAATGAALLLYRSSSALFDGDSIGPVKAKRIRLTGSVVIAALAYIGMWQATSRLGLLAAGPDRLVVGQQDAMSMVKAALEHEEHMVEVSGCAEAIATIACRETIATARRSARELREKAESFVETPKT